MKILITSGDGYIGSYVIKTIIENTNYEVIVIDNLSTGNKYTISQLRKINKEINFKRSDENFKFFKLDL